MPFPFQNSFGSFGAQPPPKRLTYEEILAHLQPPAAAPEAPTPYGGFGDLPADQQRGGKLDALWAGLAALSGGITSGHWGQAAAQGTGAIQDIQANAVRQANAQQDAGYQAKLAATQQKAEQERAKQQAAALSGMFDRAAEGEDPNSPFVQQAADAARRGDMSSLEKMASPETKSGRAWAAARGLNPDAWDTIERRKAELADQLQKKKLEMLAGPEAAAAAAKAKAEQDARLPGEKELKLAPSYQAPAQYEPLSRIAAREEMVQSIRDRHEKAKAGAGGDPGGRLFKQGEQIVYAVPPSASNPNGLVKPLDGQPEQVGDLTYFSVEGRRYVQNKERPDLGAREVPLHEDGDEGVPPLSEYMKNPKPRGGTAAPKVTIPGDPHPERPLPQRVSDVESAVGSLSPAERAAVAASLQTMLPRDVVAEIKRRRAVRP